MLDPDHTTSGRCWPRRPGSPDDQRRRRAAAHLAPATAGLVFPADWWEIVIHGETYGADHRTRAVLARLRRQRYDSFADLVDAAAALPDDLPVEATARPER